METLLSTSRAMVHLYRTGKLTRHILVSGTVTLINAALAAGGDRDEILRGDWFIKGGGYDVWGDEFAAGKGIWQEILRGAIAGTDEDDVSTKMLLIEVNVSEAFMLLELMTARAKTAHMTLSQGDYFESVALMNRLATALRSV